VSRAGLRSTEAAVTSAEQLVLSPALEDTDLTAGVLVFAVSLPAAGNAYEQFIQLMQINTGTAWTSGTFNAYLTDAVPAWKSYADGQK